MKTHCLMLTTKRQMMLVEEANHAPQLSRELVALAGGSLAHQTGADAIRTVDEVGVVAMLDVGLQ
jgi:hypothetical protein